MSPLGFLQLYKIIFKYLPDLATSTSYQILLLACKCACSTTIEKQEQMKGGENTRHLFVSTALIPSLRKTDGES